MRKLSFDTAVMWLARVLMAASAASLFVMMLLIVEEVILRYFFHKSLFWPVEIVEFIMVGITFLSLAYVESQDKHILVDALVTKFSKSTQAVIAILTNLAGLFLFIIVIKTGWDYTTMAWTFDSRSLSIVRLPLWPERATIPVGGFVMCLILLLKVAKNVAFLSGKQVTVELAKPPDATKARL